MYPELSKNKLKQWRSLQQKKFRQELRLFIVEGIKMVEECMASDFEVQEILIRKDVQEKLKFNHPHVFVCDQASMEAVSSLNTAPEVLAIVRQHTLPFLWEEGITGKYIYLDGIRDPGNLGTILRIADWFGWKGIICSPDSVELYNPKTIQASMGSVLRMPVISLDRDSALAKCRSLELCLVIADMNGEKQFSPLNKGLMLVIGSESHGVSPFWKDNADRIFSIPGSGRAESLNAAVAAGIICYELSRPAGIPG